MTKKEWAHQLNTGIAAALGLFEPPDLVDEVLLASVLREVSSTCDVMGSQLFLRAMADALDNPSAALRLTLGKGRRGRPADTKKIERALEVGAQVTNLVREGWKKEAAVQEAMSALGLSRSAVLRSCAEYESLVPLLDAMKLVANSPVGRMSK